MLDSRYRGKGGELFALTLTCLGLVLSLLSLFHNPTWATLILCTAVAGVVFSLYHVIIGPGHTPVPKGWTFPGVGMTTDDRTLFGRRDEKESVKRAILNSQPNTVCVITGKSGTGKTVLIASVAKELQQEGWTVTILNAYDHLKSTLAEAATATSAKDGRGTLVVFDQAEQLTNGYPDTAWLQTWVREFIRHEHARCAFVVRQDYYFNLRFLGDLLPCPDKVTEVRGVLPDYEAMRRKLEQVCEARLVDRILLDLEEDGRVSPLEVQMVGFVLERQNGRSEVTGPRLRRVSMETYQRLGGRAGVFREYFVLHVNACRDRDTALAVLFALSTSALRGRMYYNRLKEITYYQDEYIEDVLRVFVNAHLITRRDDGEDVAYEWAHDILPDRFRVISAGDMDSGVRDNLTFLTERRVGVASRVLSLTEPTYKRRDVVMFASLVISGVVLAVAKLGIVVSTAGFMPVVEVDEGRRAAYPLFGWMSEFLWGYFLYRVRWLYIRSSRRSGGVWWWGAMPVTGMVCVLGTWVEPSWWLLWMGLSAVVLGLGLIVTPWGRGLSKQSARKFRAFGLDSVAFGVFLCVALGLVNVALGDTLVKAVGGGWFGWWLNYEGFVLSVVALMAIREKGNRSALTMYLGLLDRRNEAEAGGQESGKGAPDEAAAARRTMSKVV